MEERLEKIVNNINRILAESNEETQTDKAIEELSELIRAIIRYRQSPSNATSGSIPKTYKKLLEEIAYIQNAYNNLIEEIADVQIMLYQLTSLYGISDDDIYNMMIAKTDRTLERLGCKNDNC